MEEAFVISESKSMYPRKTKISILIGNKIKKNGK